MKAFKHVKLVAGSATPGTFAIVTRALENPIGWQTLQAAGLDLTSADNLWPKQAQAAAERLDKWIEMHNLK